MKRITTTAIAILFLTLSYSQDSLQNLKEVMLYKKIKDGYTKVIIGDSVLNATNTLTEVLQQYTAISFKEYGKGQLSSIAFRGTSAAQTAVYWNGVPINSMLNGQTNFNTIATNFFDVVTVENGGNSAGQGSGAIGGSVFLKDNIHFGKGSETSLQAQIGSYDSYGFRSKYSYSSKDFYIKAGLQHYQSRNDYPFIGFDVKHENAAYYNWNFNLNVAYKWNSANSLEGFAHFFDGANENGRTLYVQSVSATEDANSRFLLRWLWEPNNIRNKLSTAYFKEHYKYYMSKYFDTYSFGEVDNYRLEDSFTYFLNSALQLDAGFSFQYSEVEGSNIPEQNRTQTEFHTRLSHKINNRIAYNVQWRKAISSDFSVPHIFSFDIQYEPAAFYGIKANTATNFRQPTFNDLYWAPGGNLDLNVEKAWTIEASHYFKKKFGALSLFAQQSFFHIDTEDLIQWQPMDSGNWSPINIAKTNHYGMECSLKVDYVYKSKHLFQLQANYAYTIAEDEETDLQLIYVPKHTFSSVVNYRFKKKLNTSIYWNYYDDMFTIADHTDAINSAMVMDVKLAYPIGIKKPITIGLRINNIWNTAYLLYDDRPMPDRNIQCTINYNF